MTKCGKGPVGYFWSVMSYFCVRIVVIFHIIILIMLYNDLLCFGNITVPRIMDALSTYILSNLQGL